MKLLLTGAAGRLGSVVCQELHQAGHEVIPTDSRLNRDLPVKIHLANLMNLIDCLGLTEGVEAVVHLANNPHPSRNHPEQVYIENCTINMNLFSAAGQNGVKKVIFASSIQACSGDRARGAGEMPPSQLPYFPLDGELPANPGNTYGLSKEAGEANLRLLVKKAGVQGIALRFPWLMALPDADNRTWRRVHYSRTGANTNPDEGFTYLSQRDAARLISRLLEVDLPGYRCYLPAATDNAAQMSMQQMVAEYFQGVRLKMPVDQMTGPADISRITTETGWEPVDRLERVEQPTADEPG
jgi:nucleoside-diphosphate-sugar epimerase